MKRSIILLNEEAKGKMSGYVVLANYRYMNLCTKAEPASLLCITVELEGVEYNLEDVADVANPQPDQLALFPKDKSPELEFAICKGIKTSHPEFDVDVKKLESEENDGNEPMNYILLTMPEVDKPRHDVLIEAVDSLCDECTGKLDFVFQDYTQKITLKLAGASKEELDEAKDELQSLHDKHKEMLDTYTEDKKKQIEEAYERYQEKHEASEQEKQEDESAHSEVATQTMSFDDDVF